MNAITDVVVSDQQSALYFTVDADGDPDSGLVVRGFKVFEGLSRLYEIELELASRREDIDLTRLVDTRSANDRHLFLHRASHANRCLPGGYESGSPLG